MTLKRVGIVGSGIMGSGIAETVAKAGFDVVLRSRSAATADATRVTLEKGLAKQVARGKLEQQVAEAVIDRVRTTAELADLDLVGLDTSVAILDTLHAEHGDPGTVAAPRLRRMVSARHLGRKSGIGFYRYEDRR